MLVLVGLIKLAAAVDFFAGARFGVAFLADDVLFAGAATDAAAFAFGVSFFALAEVLVAAALPPERLQILLLLFFLLALSNVLAF